jgi:cytochrome c oxidase subunit 2
MRLKGIIHIKGVFGLVFGLLFLFHSPSFAQTDTASVNADTEQVATTDSSAVDSATATDVTEEVSASSTPASSPSTAAVSVEEEAGIPAQVYVNFFYYVLLFVLVCFIVTILGQVLSVYELTQGLRRRQAANNWHSHQAWFFLVGLIVFLYGIYWSYAHHGAQSFREAATEHGARIDTLFIITTIITTIVLILTHIALFGFAFKYRGSDKRKAYFYPHNNTLEKIWTITPAVVLTVLVLFGFFTWRGITNIPEEQQKEALQIEVTAEQFAWNIRYGGRDNTVGKRNFKLTTPTNGLGIDFTDNSALDDIRAGDIVIPVGKPVHFTINSKDVLHSFYIPEFRVQINAVPGMPTFFYIVPKYTTEEMRSKLDDPNYNFILLCAKICGSGHYNMQKKVIVVTDAEYKEWLSQQTYYFDEAMQKEFKELSQPKQANLVSDGNKMVSNN